MSTNSKASRPRVDNIWSVPTGGSCSTGPNQSVTTWSISTAASSVAERCESCGARRMARFKTRITRRPSSTLLRMRKAWK